MNIKRITRWFYPGAVIIAAISLLMLIPKTHGSKYGKVRRVIDGDTIELYDGRIVRYLGIEAPNLKRFQAGRWIVSPEPLSVEARQFNERLALDKPLRLEFDAQQKDSYGRVLAYCFIADKTGEIFVNYSLIGAGLGYAVVTPPNLQYVDLFFKAERDARIKKLGIWRDMQAVTPKQTHKFFNRNILVEGTIVAAVETSRSVILKFHKSRLSYLKLIINKQFLEYFYQRGIDPKSDYIGKNVRVFGFISNYSGPEMMLAHPRQIEIVNR